MAITRHMVAKLPYDIEKDFQPIALIVHGHLMLAVSPKSDIKSVKELIEKAKANPGKLTNASSSNGSPGHVGGELFKFMTGTQIQHVPYRGGAPAINDLVAGHVDLMFESLNSHFQRRQVRPGQGARGERRQALDGVPGPADHRGGGRAGLQRADLDQPGRTRGTAASRSSTSSTPRSTARSGRRGSRRGLPRSATSRPAARRRTSPIRSRRTRRNGRTWWSARARSWTKTPRRVLPTPPARSWPLRSIPASAAAP